MEMLVVIAIITVLAAIAYPIIVRMRANANKMTALNRMKQLAAAVHTYTAENSGVIPAEDAPGKELGWASFAAANTEKAWYNAIPHQLREKSVADFYQERRTADFYTHQNILYLPGAQYPMKQIKNQPLFAIAMNTKLHHRARGPNNVKTFTGLKADMNISTVQLPSRTVLFLERGLPGELRAHPAISKTDYSGSCKANAQAFVARYTNKGILVFFDGHAEEVSGKDLLTTSGTIIWDATLSSTNPSAIFWTPDPTEDPNPGI